MSIHPIRKGDTGEQGNPGQFASRTPRAEPSGIDISAAREDAVLETTRQVQAVAEEMISYETTDGSFLEAIRIDDAEFEMRDRVRYVPEEEFQKRFDTIAKLTERVSIVEATNSMDVDQYEEYGHEYGLEESDFPVEDYEDDSIYNDCDAFRSAVIAELESDIYRNAKALAEADQAAYENRPPEALHA
jgi:hypothetical protein